MKFSKIVLTLFLVNSFNLLQATPEKTDKKIVFQKVSGKVSKYVRVHSSKQKWITKPRGSSIHRSLRRPIPHGDNSDFGKIVPRIGATTPFGVVGIVYYDVNSRESYVFALLRTISEDQGRFYIKMQYPPIGYLKHKEVKFSKSTESKFGQLALPEGINNALQNSNDVKIEVKFYETNDQGEYKLYDRMNNPLGSFEIMLADGQPETTEPQSEPEAPTPAEEPAGGSPHTWAPGIEKDFAVFKEEVMSEIADLKKMVNHLMEKMNK